MNDTNLSYRAGAQVARMSLASRVGASIGVVGFVVGLGLLAMLWAQPQNTPVTPVATGPTQSEQWALARAAESKALQEKCTAGLPDLLEEAKTLLAAGDENLAAATLNSCNSVSKDPALAALVKKIEAARRVKLAKAERAESERKKKAGVHVGMSKSDVIASMWGKPRKINRTTTARGTREQWVYDGGYLYFDDDSLTTIQN